MKKSVLLFLVGFTILTGCGKAVDESKQSQVAAVDPEIPQIESEVSVSASEDNARVTERSPEEIQRELESVPDMITEPTVISGINIDDIIEFGNYEQDYNKENGAEPIEWYVIDIDDKCAKLMSVYALDCEKYNNIDESVTWENCTLRKWLNEEFYNEAFSSNDKSIIRLTDLENESNPKSNISGGNNTTDRVFILSYGEAVKYFNADINASQENPYDYHIACIPTRFAEIKGLEANNSMLMDPSIGATCSYWFRTVGNSQNRAVDVWVGFINVTGSDVNSGKHGVRPCITINLDGVLAVDEDVEKSPSIGEINALSMADAYLDAMPFSLNELIDQLEYEGFTYGEAKYAADNCGANWKEQAFLKGKLYLDIFDFSRKELIDQLEYDGFSGDEASSAASELGL